MQNKGAIRIFAILLGLVCLYQLSFTVATRIAESTYEEMRVTDADEADKYLEDFKYNIFVKEYSYMECKERELNLGLDLKGGMNVTLEISLQEMIRSLSNNSPDSTFNQAIRQATERMTTAQEDFVTLFGEEFEKIDPNARLASPAIFGYTLKEKIKGDATNAEVLEVIKAEKEAAIEQAFEVLRTRIDKFGVTQPNIQRLEGSDRILVELPGVKEPDRVRKLLQGTAKLEFWETYENQEVYGYLAEANKILRDMQAGVEKKDSTVVEEEAEEPAEVVEEVEDDTTQSLTDLFGKADGDSAEADLGEESIDDLQKNNPLFAVMSPAASQDGLYRGPVVGYASVKDTAKVNEYLGMDRVRNIFPRDLKFYWTVKSIDPKDPAQVHQLVAIKVTSRDGEPPLDGSAISDANKDFGQFGASPEVSMMMTPDGANAWKRLTGENVGRSIAIVLDDYVYSFPTVQGEISGGRSSITGNFTIAEAEDLATVLKAGKLPAPARIVEEAVVGPTLGHESITNGIYSFVGAIALVLVFMIIYYGTAGWAANLALMANVFFVFGVLSSLGAVLTLPGIAGIVLTIGISIDSNVLIFERIREELARGTGIRLAVTQGYNAAYSAIIDSNVTSLLTGIILYVFGSGPIQGFATTLIIGIFCSLFASIFITRLIFEGRLAAKRAITVATGISKGAFSKVNYDFVGKRKMAYIFSGLVILAGIGSMATRGFNYGVDFLGGRSYMVEFQEAVNTGDVSTALEGAFGGTAPTVKTFGADNRVKVITAYRIDDNSETADDEVQAALIEGLSGVAGNTAEVLSSQKVGPTIADDIKRSAVLSIFFSLIVIFLYILIRFKKWQYSLGAVIALFHDVLFVLSLFSLFYGFAPFSMEIDQAFIAAILTVVGYSINDTVVVFDRIREYQNEHQARKHAFAQIANGALNSALSRTVITSLTTFIVLLVLFLAGGETIKGFSFALLAGIVVGTYSSAFIATPVMLEFTKDEPAKEKKNK
ncbi:MAG: protein translocase subunit SecDF [Flavobacteriales bacterium]|nr:protein translocase subunit SecDF [Flavobacteriales bacterium]MCB9204702.1 protein translocase subunit SecDF [Flavobacteriales bacterium]